ncbi:DUF6460 domain-containing protein [Azospirillum soli]|uniref:DUF6460 domain-containing protein n=1 Tax=Azospirillum soli TaxID=1304799 RepID=UPI001AEA2E6C|nr:DUF6460 domain-containing protein [Azospirillum soli]MBP2314534.1 Na+/H+-dicarboxylate symporter [Azospirillum soli]
MGWIVKTLLLCFLVGLALSVLDIDPASIITNTWATIRDIADLAVGVIRWALPYILIGAVIVVPLSVLGLLLRWSRSRGP